MCSSGINQSGISRISYLFCCNCARSNHGSWSHPMKLSCGVCLFFLFSTAVRWFSSSKCPIRMNKISSNLNLFLHPHLHWRISMRILWFILNFLYLNKWTILLTWVPLPSNRLHIHGAGAIVAVNFWPSFLCYGKWNKERIQNFLCLTLTLHKKEPESDCSMKYG